jgi:hypothetical protein
MQLISELLAMGEECPKKGSLFTPEYSLFRPQIR